MKDTLEYIIKLLVDHPEEVSIEEKEEEGIHIFSINAHKEDMGKIIGKNGKIIHALRNIMKVPAIKNDMRIRIELLEKLA